MAGRTCPRNSSRFDVHIVKLGTKSYDTKPIEPFRLGARIAAKATPLGPNRLDEKGKNVRPVRSYLTCAPCGPAGFD